MRTCEKKVENSSVVRIREKPVKHWHCTLKYLSLIFHVSEGGVCRRDYLQEIFIIMCSHVLHLRGIIAELANNPATKRGYLPVP
jgi:hypothetical protein